MAWDWDHLSPQRPEQRRGALFEETYGPKQPRWTRSEVSIALLVAAILAATVVLAALTPAAHQ